MNIKSREEVHDILYNFYLNKKTTKIKSHPFFHIGIYNECLGLGDTVVLTPFSEYKFIFSDSPSFNILMKYNKYYKDCFAIKDNFNSITEYAKYDWEGGHAIQRISKALGLPEVIKPKGTININKDIVKGRIGFCLEKQIVNQHSLDDKSKKIFEEFITSTKEYEFIDLSKIISLDELIKEISKCEFFIGLNSGPMHIAAALEIKSIIIVSRPDCSSLYLPRIKEVEIEELEWLYPQNVHLHTKGMNELVEQFNKENLLEAIKGNIYPYWSNEYLDISFKKQKRKKEKMNTKILGHTSFLGFTGYNNHSRNFFTHLNKHYPTRIRNYTHCSDLTYLTEEQKNMIIEQTWNHEPFKVGLPFVEDHNSTYVNIVLNESQHYYFYDKYESPMIAYNVWESTKQIPEYFNRILQYDQFWCPTEWQRKCTIDQGYPEDRVKVVPEGVDGKRFYPLLGNERALSRLALCKKYNIPVNAFIYMVFGRWDYRKSIEEIVRSYYNKFKNDPLTYLVLSVDNPFPVDGMHTTEERLAHHGLDHPNIKVIHFPSDQEYTKWLQAGDCLVSCARSEGWNLPLLEAISCGIPTICSNWGAQLEFADGISLLVDVPKFKKAEKLFMVKEGADLGEWGEPDFDHLSDVMVSAKEGHLRDRAVKLSKYIREAYSWDNAALKAKNLIDELLEKKSYVVPDIVVEEKSPNKNPIKLNLGCGNDIKAGYINIDKYNNTKNADLNCDFENLPFIDGGVDEIYASHIFEHISFLNVYSVIDEWKRVLRIGGVLEIRVPNLMREAKIWMDASDSQKWFEVHRIYGGQNFAGNFHYTGFSVGSLRWLLENLGLQVISCEIHHSDNGEEIQCISRKKLEGPIPQATYNIHFVDGPFAEIKGNNDDKSFYLIDFFDTEFDSSIHQATLRVNHWTRPHKKYFSDYKVRIQRNGKLEFEHQFNAKDKIVLISFDSKSLGDTIAWIPYVEEFRKKHECKAVVSTFWNHLFEKHPTYSQLKFVSPGTSVDNLYASYTVGCYEGNRWKNKIDWRIVTLQQICSDTLGIEYKEIIPDIDFTPGKRPVEENIKYVTLSEFSTFQCKFWNYPDGWQKVIDYLNSVGYKVMVISKEETKLKNIINKTGEPLWNTMNNIYHSEFFMGVSAGPAWLSWTLRKPVVMISGCTKKMQEFESNLIRVINEDVCHGCINDVNNNFERGDWNYCPRQKGTDRQFECTKTITPDMVIEQMKELIK